MVKPHPVRYAFIGAALLVLVGTWLIVDTELEATINEIKADESLHVRLGKGAIVRKLESASRDIAYLSRHSALRSAIAPRNPKALDHLAQDLETFALANRSYNQLRWIDQSGMEKIRIDFADGKAWRVPNDQLQNKSGRYFFTDTIKLKPGKVFVSPLDLNIEGNAIELPFKPMIRFATPLRDEIGKSAGIFIINYFGQDLLDAFSEAIAGATDHTMLLNAEGYWLSSPHVADAWGFMFKDNEKTLATRDPEAWRTINSQDTGQKEVTSGLWTWTTVRPLLDGQVSSSGAAEAVAASAETRQADRYVWKIASHQPKEQLSALRQRITLRASAIATGFLLLLFYFSRRMSHAWKNQLAAEQTALQANIELQDAHDELDTANQNLTQQLERFHTIIDTTTEGFLVLGPQGEILQFNKALSLMLDHPAMQLPTLRFTDIYALDLIETLQPELEKTIRDKTNRWEGILVKADGMQINVEVSAAYDPELGIIAFIRDISRRKRLEAELKALATTDMLTDLPNRRETMARLIQELNRLKRFSGKPAALLMIDIDHFKQINDHFGHAGGDQALKAFGQLLGNRLRKTDLAGRIGGEEFVAMLTGTDIDQAIFLAETLRKKAADIAVETPTSTIRFTISIGLTFMAASDTDIDVALARADAALYDAKRSGRDQLVINLPDAIVRGSV